MKKEYIIGILGLFIPGIGQMYSGKKKLGILFLFLTIIGYIIYIPLGYIIHTTAFADYFIKNKVILEKNVLI